MPIAGGLIAESLPIGSVVEGTPLTVTRPAERPPRNTAGASVSPRRNSIGPSSTPRRAEEHTSTRDASPWPWVV